MLPSDVAAGVSLNTMCGKRVRSVSVHAFVNFALTTRDPCTLAAFDEYRAGAETFTCIRTGLERDDGVIHLRESARGRGCPSVREGESTIGTRRPARRKYGASSRAVSSWYCEGCAKMIRSHFANSSRSCPTREFISGTKWLFRRVRFRVGPLERRLAARSRRPPNAHARSGGRSRTWSHPRRRCPPGMPHPIDC